MAGRFPGARNLGQFWQNLRDGVESIRTLSDAELLASGVSPQDLARPDYVKRAAVLDDVPLFDAAFFGLSPKDAAIMDPQHRHFLECAWEALEDAGHPAQLFGRSIAVFAGSGMNSYLIQNLLANRALLESAGLFQLRQTGNDKDVLATRVSYELDLRGPSINVQTACSTSLVAVHLACQSLLNYECDMALAGGVTIEIPHGQGYFYREGEILSRDGHCRSFDAASTGTVFGSGVGIVVLRRLEDAIEDRDAIRAVILGSAINNDGARKVGYLAPSVEGQADVIAEAIDFAEVAAGNISYVEAHGTGTAVGDPIEVRALTQAFRKSTARSASCAIGSVKTNIGHLDAAAGVAGLIKTVLALEHAELPPSLHFQNPNPHIEFQGSPFYVNSQLRSWPSTGEPRRAGVTSLGIGGTNAHLVLEEAPRRSESAQAKPYRLLTVSAKSASALDRAASSLFTFLDAHSEIGLADAAFTCQLGRNAFPHRRAVVVADTRQAISALASGEHKQFADGLAAKPAPQAVFLFSGQGSQYVNMGRELYEYEEVFRETLDDCARHLLGPLGLDLRQVLYPPESEQSVAAEKLNRTWLTQPALFAIEFSLARWWISLGIEPVAMVGHSIGEYVAACLAGVFSLEDALAIVAFRGRLMNDLPPGAMLAVARPSAAVSISGNLFIAAINHPEQCVVSGPADEIAMLEQTLAAQSIACRRLITSHAFHSAMMDPILGAFEERLRGIAFNPPRVPYLSNVTGTWIEPLQATDPAYWTRHLRQTVRFSDCLAELLRKPDQVLIEVGPGNVLASLARQQGEAAARALQSLPHPRESGGGLLTALHTLGQLWAMGAEVNWAKLHAAEPLYRVPLPTYPFEHKRFWIEPDKPDVELEQTSASSAPDARNLFFYRRTWKPAPGVPQPAAAGACWVVFNDSLGLGNRVLAKLAEDKQYVVLVEPGTSYARSAEGTYSIRPGVREDYDELVADLLNNGHAPGKILHLWSLSPQTTATSLQEVEERSFFSPLFLAQALAGNGVEGVELALVSNHMQQVSDEPVRHPARAVLLGPARVVPLEHPSIACRSIDVDYTSEHAEECAAQLLAEMHSAADNASVAFRGGRRFVETVQPLDLDTVVEHRRIEHGGVYLITGGLGGLGLAVAAHLAAEFSARLILVARSAPPPEAQWESSAQDADLGEDLRQRFKKLLEIRSNAAGLLVLQADVTNLPQMRDVVAQATGRFGRIDGVFHAAGVLDDGPLLLKTAPSAARVLDPKVRGTLVLEAALRTVPLRCFVLFSSVSSIFPPPGQVYYAAANAFLDAFALSRKGTVLAIDWGAWRNVGMAARAASPHPLLQQRLVDSPQQIVYAGTFSPQRIWQLAEHRLKTARGAQSLMPGTAYMEMAAAALSRGSRHGAIELRDVFFLVPMTIEDNELREVRVQLEREQNPGDLKNAYLFSVSSHLGEWVEHATGTIAQCTSHPPAHLDPALIAARCIREVVFNSEHRMRQERQLIFGPRWQSMHRLLIGDREALAEIELDAAFSADLAAYRMHPALLDLATGAAFYLTGNYETCNDLFLPISYRRIRAYHPLPARLFSHVRARQGGSERGEIETFDVTLFDGAGTVLAEIEGFSARRIANPAEALAASASARVNDSSAGRQAAETLDLPGILPADGVRALMRILSVQSPHSVIALSEPLSSFDSLGTTAVTENMSAGTHAAPAISAIEDTLAAWWQETLGVDQVGLDDDFFLLGGHSLTGVRLLVKIKNAYQVNLELTVLFEVRTIRRLAEEIRRFRELPAD